MATTKKSIVTASSKKITTKKTSPQVQKPITSEKLATAYSKPW